MAQLLSPWRWLALPLSLALLAGSGAAHADEADHERARRIYEIKVLRTSGTLVKLKVDARDGTVLGSKSRNHPPAGAR